MRVHTSHQPYGYPLFTLCSWQWARKNPWCSLQHLNYHCVGCWLLDGAKITTCTSFKHVQLLLMMSQHYVHQRWHSHLSQHCRCDPMQVDLFSQSYTTQGFATYNATQVIEWNYCDWHPTNQFFPLVVEVFGCLHKQADMFLHNCANAIWSFKWPEGLHFYVLVTFIHQKVLIKLQRLQTSSILNWARAIGLTTSWLPPLRDTPPITMANLLQVIGFWHRKIQSTYYKLSVFDDKRFQQLV
jgi:hypothetical protein